MSNGNNGVTWRERIRELVAAGAIVGAAATGAFLADPAFDWGLHIVFFEVGQADAIALVTRGGEAAVIDAGNYPSHGRRIAEFLGDPAENGAGEIEAVSLAFATHYDQDHIRGFLPITQEGIDLEAVYDQGPSLRRSGRARYTEYLTAVGDANDNGHDDPGENSVRHTAEPGMRFDLGPATIRVLAVSGDTYGTANDIDLDPSTHANTRFDENCGSIALLVRLGQFELYTAGDQTSDAWRDFADTEIAVVRSSAFGNNRDIDVLKVNHHGSDSSNGPRFLHALDPEVAIISSEFHTARIPKTITIQELLKNGAVVLITGDAHDDEDDGKFPKSVNTDWDDDFDDDDNPNVFNDVGDVHIYVARNGLSYRVVAGDYAEEFSARDSENIHEFSYDDDEYPPDQPVSVGSDGLPRCRS